jgi:hypothetical protein
MYSNALRACTFALIVAGTTQNGSFWMNISGFNHRLKWGEVQSSIGLLVVHHNDKPILFASFFTMTIGNVSFTDFYEITSCFFQDLALLLRKFHNILRVGCISTYRRHFQQSD